MPQSNDRPAPHQTVTVKHSNNDYVNVCARYGGGRKALDRWIELGDFLAYRPGWHFDVVNEGEALWSLGVFGESLLNIAVSEDAERFACFDSIEDRSVDCRSLAELDSWLESIESDRKRPSPLLMRIASDADWRVLKASAMTVRVSWSDNWFMADVETVPEEAIFEKDLETLVRNVRLLVTSYFGAPAAIAPELTNITVKLDPSAVQQIASNS